MKFHFDYEFLGTFFPMLSVFKKLRTTRRFIKNAWYDLISYYQILFQLMINN